MAMVRHDDPEAMARETDELLRTPYPALKVKIGMGVAADIARYRAVREAAGDRATIQVDGNGGYSLGQAMTALGAMERLGGLGMIEQPVARMDDLAALAAHFAAPVMADESFDGPDALLEIARRGAAQAAFLKLPKQGGILGALQGRPSSPVRRVSTSPSPSIPTCSLLPPPISPPRYPRSPGHPSSRASQIVC